MERRARRHVVVAVMVALALVALALVAAACGSSKSASSGTSSDTAKGTDPTIAASGPPKTGGTLRYGVDGETDGFDPTKNRWAPSGTEIGMAIFDPLAAYDVDAKAQPYLAESFTHDPGFTRWTVTLRSGVTFQDGTPLSASVLQTVFNALLASPLTRPAMADLDHVEVTGDLTADFVMKAAWAAFPSSLTGQLGMVPSPGMLADPNGSRAPVGTGPFSFKEWVPDNHLTVVRNPHYWRSDSAGTPLPYLDQVDFKVIVEDASKLDATLAGDIDMAVSAVPADVVRIEQAAADGKLQAVQNQGETEEAFVQLNTAKPPFDNLTARQAMAYATDEQAYIATLDQNVTTPVYNVFREGTPYYREAPYPRYDLDKAKSLVQAYEQETGQPLAFSLASLATSDSRLQTQYLKSVWEQAGMKVDIVQTEQTKFIVDAVTGNYQAVAWGQFGSPDPDYDYVWWISDNAAPIGQLGLNIARNKDPEIDKALRAARATDDQKVREDNYAIVAARLNQDLPYIWLARPRFLLYAVNAVRGITNGPLPDGQASYPMGGPGGISVITRLTQTWLDR